MSKHLEHWHWGNRIIEYNIPPQEYLAAAAVEESWDSEAITSPDEKRWIPDLQECHVDVRWRGHPSLGGV